MSERFEAFEEAVLDPVKQGVVGALAGLRGSFSSAVKPENGVFGSFVTEVMKDNGILERTWKTENNTTFREYLQDGKPRQTREAFPDRLVVETRFDDNGTAYLTSKAHTGLTVGDRVNALTPDVLIQKGNFTAKTDHLGRTIQAGIEDLRVKAVETARESMSQVAKDASFLQRDDSGHLIADRFFGPASQENVVAQLDKVNRSTYKKMENYVAQLNLDHPNTKVDLNVKVNYKGTDKRPSSFEPTVKVDGVKHELPKEFHKIYNVDNPGTLTRIITTAGEKFGLAHDAGVKSGLAAVTLSTAISTVDNVTQVIKGEITAQEAFVDVAKDAGIAGAVGYGTTFVSTTVASAMRASSHTLIQSLGSLGNGCVPAAVVSFGVASFDSAIDFAQGEIDGKQLALQLGENAASVGGGMAGGALAGAALGSVVPGAGNVVGFAVGLVGGMVGCALASEAYATAVEVLPEIADALKEKAQMAAGGVVDLVSNTIPEKLEDVKSAINTFAAENKVPIRL